jgi:hypothetical protein
MQYQESELQGRFFLKLLAHTAFLFSKSLPQHAGAPIIPYALLIHHPSLNHPFGSPHLRPRCLFTVYHTGLESGRGFCMAFGYTGGSILRFYALGMLAGTSR